MSATHADQLIDGYIARLRDAAADLPKTNRSELIDDMRSHIAEARSREADETDASILNILDRLGEPGVVVADARERLGLRATQPARPGVLEIAAVILVPFFWPVGVLLLWLSPAWNRRDKLIGTFFPPGGYLGISLFSAMFVSGTRVSRICVAPIDAAGRVMAQSCSGSPAPPAWQSAAGTLFAVVILALPLLTAAYLAFRLRGGGRLRLSSSY